MYKCAPATCFCEGWKIVSRFNYILFRFFRLTKHTSSYDYFMFFFFPLSSIHSTNLIPLPRALDSLANSRALSFPPQFPLEWKSLEHYCNFSFPLFFFIPILLPSPPTFFYFIFILYFILLLLIHLLASPRPQKKLLILQIYTSRSRTPFILYTKWMDFSFPHSSSLIPIPTTFYFPSTTDDRRITVGVFLLLLRNLWGSDLLFYIFFCVCVCVHVWL